MQTWGAAGRGITALVGAAVVVLAGTAVPPAALADELGDSAPAKGSVPLREGQIVTVAGTGEEGYSGDGHDALDARINALASISVGPDGSVYIADSLNERLRVVSPDGVIDTAPGGPSQVVRASAVGPDGSLYLAADDGIRQVE